MRKFNTGKLVRAGSWSSLLPYAAVGVIAFSLPSAANLNDLFSVYLVLLSAKLGVVLIYFLKHQLPRSARKNLIGNLD